jgi:DNA polymerase-3 subunit gamma/tau
VSRALYRKYRSKSLNEIVGQQHVTEVLQKSLQQGKVAHAYLLTGPRGVGKTSIARILAHEINQLPYSDDTTHLDIIEIDAASNNGVEDVRDLRDKVQIAPVSASRKVYIIDEVHMLSKAAFNALLKTLEEPPQHVVFILATTDVEKLPPTIISRTQRFSFRAIAPKDATAHLKAIAEKEGIAIDDDAIELIAERGDGSFRDSISLLDQISGLHTAHASITRGLIEQSLGLAPAEEVSKLLQAYEARDLAAIVSILNDCEEKGVQTIALTDQLIRQIREILLEKPQYFHLLDQLIELPRSSRPSLKLLTILAENAVPAKLKTAALAAPAPSISASVDELKALPAKAPLQQAKTAPQAKGAPTSDFSAQTPFTGQFDWQTLVDHTREHFVAIYSVLAKCQHELQNGTLTIYTGNAFYKKKLDDTRYRLNLTKSLEAIGAAGLEVDTVPTPPPPKDSVAASVAVIMGGGEEVTVE